MKYIDINAILNDTIIKAFKYAFKRNGLVQTKFVILTLIWLEPLEN